MSHIVKAKNRNLESMGLNRVYSKLNGLLSVLLCFSLAALLGCAGTNKSAKGLQPEEPAVVTGIDIQENMVTITADKPFIYTIYKPGDPYKMVVDLPDVKIGAFDKKIVSRKSGVAEISPSQINSPSLMARLEMLLQSPSLVEQEYKNNVLKIRIKEDPAEKHPPKEVDVTSLLKEQKEPSPKNVSPAPDFSARAPLSKATEISDISFDVTAGTVKILVKGNGSMVPNVFPLDNRIVIDIADVVLNAPMPATVISPVKGLRSGKHEDKVRLVIDLKEKTNFDVTAIGDSIVVALKRSEKDSYEPQPAQDWGEDSDSAESAGLMTGKVMPEVPSAGKCERYLGGKENVNFDFQDQDIVPVLRLFADIAGCNLFIHPDVKGRATMKFRDVPWDQAFDTILKTFSLGKLVEGNIIRIAPNTVFARESDERVKVQEASMKAEPLETRVYPVSYAEVNVVQDAVKNAKILTSRGSVSVDKRTSTMLIKDIASVFPEVDRLLATLDKPTPQVLIEARIMEINTNNAKELGIQWGLNIDSPNTLSSFGGLSGTPSLSTGSTTGKNYLVDFPAKSANALSGSGFTIGLISPDRTMGLDLQLSAAESVGKGKVVSNPKILTVDNGRAKILQGKSIPIRKLTTEGTVSTEFKDITLELNVTPHITPDNAISMVLEIKKEELDPTVPSIDGVPGTDKKEANTNVIIKDGETIVIGGMYKVNTVDSETGVPWLKNVPLFGWLFRTDKKEVTTSELLIFITPRIMGNP